MQIIKRPFEAVPQFSDRDIAYTLGDEKLKPFYKYEPELAAFSAAIADRKNKPVDRALLVKVLESQAANYPDANKVKENIAKLTDKDTFTVITAHQPSLFTGPLYFIYKIISTIRLAETLKKSYPKYNFVPLFVSGGEDHDFEEINHLKLFGKDIVWEGEAGGPVGRMSSAQILPLVEIVKGILGERDAGPEVVSYLEKSFTQESSYGKGMLLFVHQLFSQYGLVTLGMDHPALKAAFIPKIKKELFDRPSEDIVKKTQSELEALGFKAQAFARPINFFYMTDAIRNRIEYSDGQFSVLDTDIKFSEAEILQEIVAHPERFSPNVVMRPIYQETILPNLAYIGGGGELAYWLERKNQFKAFDTFFPMLIRRNSALWLDGGGKKKLSKLDLGIETFFAEENNIIKGFVKSQSDEPLDFSEPMQEIENALTSITDSAEKVDASLAKSLAAEQVRLMKQIEQLSGRILRAEKGKHEKGIDQIKKLKEKYFPSNGLQERKENFLGIYQKYGKAFFDTLLKELDVFEKKFIIFIEE